MENKNESKVGLRVQVDNLIQELENTGTESDEQQRQTRKKISENLIDLQESLDYLRIAVKYQVFDLEATRRENAYLRGLLKKLGEDHE